LSAGDDGWWVDFQVLALGPRRSELRGGWAESERLQTTRAMGLELT
jgi:hypothetical protein